MMSLMQQHTILIREGKSWRQYFVVRDARVAIVEMVPAGIGWNIGRVTIQGSADWNKMTREQILAWKKSADDGRTSEATGLPADFVAKLLAL